MGACHFHWSGLDVLMYGINLIALSEGFYGHLLERTFIRHYLHSAEVTLAHRTRCRQNWRAAVTFIKRDLEYRWGVSHKQPASGWPIFFFFTKSQNLLLFSSLIYFGLAPWVRCKAQRSIVNPTGKIQRRLMFQYVRFLESPAGGENPIPEVVLPIFTLPRSCREHPQRVQWVTQEVSSGLSATICWVPAD